MSGKMIPANEKVTDFTGSEYKAGYPKVLWTVKIFINNKKGIRDLKSDRVVYIIAQ